MKKQNRETTFSKHLNNPQKVNSQGAIRAEKNGSETIVLSNLSNRHFQRLTKQIEVYSRIVNEYTLKCQYHIKNFADKQIQLEITKQQPIGYQSLRQILTNRTGQKIQKGSLIEIMKNLSMAYGYFHVKGVPHNNINLGSIFIKQKQIKVAPPKLKFLDNNERRMSFIGNQRAVSLTNIYVSPQVKDGQVYDTGSDVWALGLVFLQLCVNKYLQGQKSIFAERKFVDYYHQIKNQEIVDLIASMLQQKKDKRNILGKVYEKLQKYQLQQQKPNFWNPKNKIFIPQQPAERSMRVKLFSEQQLSKTRHSFKQKPIPLAQSDSWFRLSIDGILNMRYQPYSTTAILGVTLAGTSNVKLYAVIDQDNYKRFLCNCQFSDANRLAIELSRKKNYEVTDSGELIIYFMNKISCENIVELLQQCKLNSNNCNRNIVQCVYQNNTAKIAKKSVLIHPHVLLTTANATVDQSSSKQRLLVNHPGSKIFFPKQYCQGEHSNETKFNFSLIFTEKANDSFGVIDFIKNYDEKKMVRKTKIRFSYLIGDIKFKIGEIGFDGSGNFTLSVYKSDVQKLTEGLPLIICFGISKIAVCGIYTGCESGFLFDKFHEDFIHFRMMESEVVKLENIQESLVIFHEMDSYNPFLMRFSMNTPVLNTILQDLNVDDLIDQLQKSNKNYEQLAMLCYYSLSKEKQINKLIKIFNNIQQILVNLYGPNSIYLKIVNLRQARCLIACGFDDEYEHMLKQLIQEGQKTQLNSLILMFCYRQISQHYQTITLTSQSQAYKKKAIELYDRVNRNTFIHDRRVKKQNQSIIAQKKKEDKPPVPKKMKEAQNSFLKLKSVPEKSNEEATATMLLKQAQKLLNSNTMKCLQVIDSLFKIVNKDEFLLSQVKKESVKIWNYIFFKVYRDSFMLEEVLSTIEVGSRNWLLTEQYTNVLRKRLIKIMAQAMFAN